MRGAVQAAAGIIVALILAALVASSILSAISFCLSVNKNLNIDVPPCKGATCISMAYPVKNQYGYLVGRSWQRLNDLKRSYDNAVDMCSLNFYDENGNLIESAAEKLYDAAFGFRSALGSVLLYVSKADKAAIDELSSIELELNAAGINRSTDPSWLSLYSEVLLAEKDLKNGTTKTDFGKAYQRAQPPLLTKAIPASTIIFATIYYTGQFVHVPVVIPRALSSVDALYRALSLDPTAYEDYINYSVGNHYSMLTALRSMRKLFLNLKSETDKKVEELKKTFYSNRKELLDELEPLRDENIAELASFLPSKTFVGELRVKMSYTPSFAIAKVNAITTRFDLAYNRYKATDHYLSAFEEMKEAESNLESIKYEVDRFLETINTAIDSCIGSVRSHRFHDPSLKAQAYIYLSIAKDKDKSLSIRADACNSAMKISQEDEKLYNVEKAYEECKKAFEKRWKEPLSCDESDPVLAYDCCKKESERMENLFLSSAEYLRYRDLYDTLEELLIDKGLTDLLLELYSLPRVPYNYEELHKAYSKLLVLLEKASKDLAPSVLLEWNGYLSTEGVSDVALLISNPLPISVKGEKEIPFVYYGYRVEGNGIIVRVNGKKVEYEGRGSAKVVFQAAPVELDEKVLSFNDGKVELLLRNPYSLPVKRYHPYDVVSLSSGSRYHDNYLYLLPGGFAMVEMPAIDVEKNVEGNTVVFLLRNTSPYTYRGTVKLSVRATRGPSYCVVYDTFALCKVNLRPGEEKIVKFKGILLPEEPISFSPPDEPPKHIPLVEELPPRKEGSGSKVFKELLDRLKNYLKRAKELNALDVLPFDERMIKNLENLDPSLQADAVPLLQRLDEEVRSEAEAKTKLLESLSSKLNDPDLQGMAVLAKKSLLTGDYIVPLALTKGISRYFYRGSQSGGSSMAIPVGIAVLIGIGAYAYYNRGKLQRPKRKKRIPRF